jgi:Tol biopolymer transport system component
MNLWRIAIDEATGVPAGAPEPVTAGVTSAEQASLSADGSRIIFRSATVTANPVAIPFDSVAERAGAPTQLLDRTGVLAPAGISPDGQWLVLLNTSERQEDLFLMRTDGTGLRRLTDDAFRDRGAAWSPDGKEIAFYSNRKDNYDIWAIRPDGSGLRQLTEAAAGDIRNFLYPIYAPAGDRLVTFRARTPETIMIDPRREWSAQTPEQHDLALPDKSWLAPTTWSPDGRLLAGPILGGPSSAIGVYDVGSRTTRRIAEAGCTFQELAWLQDSTRLLCVDPAVDTLWLFDVESGRRRSVASGQKLGGVLTASPDRRTLYSTFRRLQADLWMAETKAKR